MKKIIFYSNAMVLLTTLHHIYGAIIYNTPERLHILFLSLPVMAYNIFMYYNAATGRISRLVYTIVTFLVSAVFIGLFEGFYNHVLKNTLFFLGVSTRTMLHMFPPPVYVMPNDFVFEFTGILQAALVFPLVLHCCRYLFPQKGIGK